MLGGMTDAILLVALGIGYIVCYLASREDKGLKEAGYVIGIVIVALSGLLLLNNLVMAGRFCGKMGGMKGMMHQKMLQQQQGQVEK